MIQLKLFDLATVQKKLPQKVESPVKDTDMSEGSVSTNSVQDPETTSEVNTVTLDVSESQNTRICTQSSEAQSSTHSQPAAPPPPTIKPLITNIDPLKLLSHEHPTTKYSPVKPTPPPPSPPKSVITHLEPEFTLSKFLVSIPQNDFSKAEIASLNIMLQKAGYAFLSQAEVEKEPNKTQVNEANLAKVKTILKPDSKEERSTEIHENMFKEPLPRKPNPKNTLSGKKRPRRN